MQNDNSFITRVQRLKHQTGAVLAVLVDDCFTYDEIDRHIIAGMSVAEIRIDMFQNQDINHIQNEIRKFADVPILATIRKTVDGGLWNGPEKERIELFKSIIPHVGAVDVELSEPESLSELKEAVSDHQCNLIASYHNFDQTPYDETVYGLINQAKDVNANAVKLACMINNEKDCSRLAALFEIEVDIPKIIIGMGPKGMSTRIKFPALGSLVTYSPSDKIIPAYGQISFSEMIDQLGDFYPTFKSE